MDEGVSMFWGRCNFKAEDGMNCLERTNSLEMSLPEDWAAGGLSQSTEPPEEPESCAPEPAPGLQTQKVQGGFWTQASGESRPGDPTGHPPMPAPVSTRGLQRLYKYTLFGFSRKGGGGLPPESKQNGFSQIAKPSEGQGGRTRATDPETRCPSLQRHGLHRALSHQLLSFCYSSLPALSSCPPFLQPGLQVLPPPCTNMGEGALPLASPLPSHQAGLIISP